MIKVLEIREDFCSVLTRLQGEVSDVPQSGQRPPPLLVLRGPEVRTPDQGHRGHGGGCRGRGCVQALQRGRHRGHVVGVETAEVAASVPTSGHRTLPGLGLGQAASRGHHQHRCGQPQHPGAWSYVTILSGMEEKLFLSTIIA